MDPITKEFVFQTGHVFTATRLCFITNHPNSTAKEVPNAQLYILRDGKNWGSTLMKWAAVELTCTVRPSPTIFVLGREGEILIGDAGGFREERIDDSGVSPLRRGPMRNIRNVSETVFAVGMAMQVYRRLGDNTWRRHEFGLPTEQPALKVVGFNSVDGPAVDDLYAVGWGGEIWHHNGEAWQQQESPTNLALFDVLAVSPSLIYACGQEGTIVKGYSGQWGIVDFLGVKADFRSMAWFNNKLFLADGHALYVLDNGVLSAVDFGVGAIVPSSHVHANEGILLSVAGKEVFITADGATWTPLPI